MNEVTYEDIYKDEREGIFLDSPEILEMTLNIDPNSDNSEIDLEKIANKLGYKIDYHDLNGYSGQIDEEKKTITLNLRDSKKRQRFTLAHEIAHHELDKTENSNLNAVKKRADKSEYNDSEQTEERKADDLAGVILMPIYLLKQYSKEWLDKYANGGNHISNPKLDSMIDFLSDKLVASVQAVKVRMIKTGILVPNREF